MTSHEGIMTESKKGLNLIAEQALPASPLHSPLVRRSDPIGPIRVRGSIVRGYQRGRELGWPTANVDSAAFKDLKDLGMFT